MGGRQRQAGRTVDRPQCIRPEDPLQPRRPYLVTASTGPHARVWAAADGKELLRYQLPGVGLGAFFTPNGGRVVTVPQTGGYHLNAFLDITDLVEVARSRLTRDWQARGNRKIPGWEARLIISGYLFLGITYGFAAAVQPGPFQSYLVSQALSHG